MTNPIDVTEFKRRLVQLCLASGANSLPTGMRNRRILFASAALLFDPSQSYSEKSVNARLSIWIDRVGCDIDVDVVTMRRWLVDYSYLKRDAAGSHYVVALSPEQHGVTAAVCKLDPVQLIEEGQRERERRKQHFDVGAKQ